MNFHCVAYSASMSCVTTVRVGGAVGENEKGVEHSIEQVPSFTKAYTAYKTVKPFLYVHSIHEHDNRMF